jgi:hypothetical protein
MANFDGDLRQLAKQRIASGELPCHPTARTWGSRGGGAQCSLCSRAIRADEIEYEVAFPDTRGHGDSRSVRFHLPCHAAWQAECRGAREQTQGA